MKPLEHLIIDWKREGLSLLVSPENSELEYLEVYSLSLKKGNSLTLDFSEREVSIFTLSGSLEVKADNMSEKLEVHDVVFFSSDIKVKVRAEEPVKAIVACAPSPIKSVLKVIKLNDVLKDPSLYRRVGEEPYFREVITMIGDNVKAARIIAGYTWVKEGNWSSWPPHEHGALMEEVYIFYEISHPGFGLQLVYEDLEKAKVYLVRENSVVVIPRGYHPNVVTPGARMKYLWIISARRAFVDRKYGAWRVHPDYEKKKV